MFWLPEMFSSSISWSCWMLSRKSSTSFFLGDGSKVELGILSSKWALLTRGVPVEKLWWTGVLPRDGVKSAKESMNTTNLMGPINLYFYMSVSAFGILYSLHSSANRHIQQKTIIMYNHRIQELYCHEPFLHRKNDYKSFLTTIDTKKIILTIWL